MASSMTSDPSTGKAPQPSPELIEQQKQNAELKKQLDTRAKLAKDEQTQYNIVKKNRNQDLKEGRARGNELFGDNTLGRVEDGRSKEISDLIAERKARANGYTPEEMNAMRDQNLSTINQENQGAARALQIQQAQNGVRGPVAMAQQAKLAQSQGAQQGNLERDLYLGNIQRRDQGLNALEQTTNTARGEELGRSQFNIGQQQREKFGQLATEMGYGGLGAGERAAVMQKIVGENQAAAGIKAAEAGGGKK